MLGERGTSDRRPDGCSYVGQSSCPTTISQKCGQRSACEDSRDHLTEVKREEHQQGGGRVQQRRGVLPCRASWAEGHREKDCRRSNSNAQYNSGALERTWDNVRSVHAVTSSWPARLCALPGSAQEIRGGRHETPRAEAFCCHSRPLPLHLQMVSLRGRARMRAQPRNARWIRKLRQKEEVVRGRSASSLRSFASNGEPRQEKVWLDRKTLTTRACMHLPTEQLNTNGSLEAAPHHAGSEHTRHTTNISNSVLSQTKAVGAAQARLPWPVQCGKEEASAVTANSPHAHALPREAGEWDGREGGGTLRGCTGPLAQALRAWHGEH